MKILIWAVAGVLALLATAIVAMLAGVLNWLLDMAPGTLDSLSRIAQWPVPSWLAAWVDPALVERLLGGVAAAFQTLRTEAPWLASLLGWVVPSLWVLWGLAMLFLAGVAGIAHALVSKSQAS
jgi:hypothetical protein